MNQITINNATIGYNKNAIINISQLKFNNQTNYLIYGDNGCGKTTFFKYFFGFSDLISGTVEFPQEISYFPVDIFYSKYLTVADYIKLVQVQDTMNCAFLVEQFLHTQIINLSMGQINRTLLYFTLNKQAKFYFIDELLNAIDQNTKDKVFTILNKMSGVLIISHEVESFVPKLNGAKLINFSNLS